MPQQTAGRLRGFQLWLNLPAREKMKPAHYRDIASSEIPTVAAAQGGQIRLIAGTLDLDGRALSGPINGAGAKISTDPLYADVHLPARTELTLPIETSYSAFLYVYEGSAQVGPAEEAKPLARRAAGVLSAGDRVRVRAGEEGARFLLLAAKPLREPVVQYGPFVMNTREEIEQALADYRDGRLAAA
jgi:redox-sensitive bicupin YhaK (pirin superfamily)